MSEGRLFALRDVTKSFGNIHAIKNVSFEIVGVVDDGPIGELER